MHTCMATARRLSRDTRLIRRDQAFSRLAEGSTDIAEYSAGSACASWGAKRSNAQSGRPSVAAPCPNRPNWSNSPDIDSIPWQHIHLHSAGPCLNLCRIQACITLTLIGTSLQAWPSTPRRPGSRIHLVSFWLSVRSAHFRRVPKSISRGSPMIVTPEDTSSS